MEGRRRVKEQLKKMGSFEYYQTSFSYSHNDTGEEHFVGVPEQGGRDLISADPLGPGTTYTAGVTMDGTVGLYRVEVSLAAGAGKLKLAGGVTARSMGISGSNRSISRRTLSTAHLARCDNLASLSQLVGLAADPGADLRLAAVEAPDSLVPWDRRPPAADPLPARGPTGCHVRRGPRRLPRRNRAGPHRARRHRR